VRGEFLLGIKTLTVRSGVCEIRQATRLKDVMDIHGLKITVSCILDPGMPRTNFWAREGKSEGWDLS
jgi:hypothetical protein